MSKKLLKKLSVLVVALVLCTATLLTACNNAEEYTPNLTMPTSKEVASNGGNAVICGEYIYFVNGYQNNNTVGNAYTKPAALGNIVRIKKADIDEVFSGSIVNKDGATATTINKDVAAMVREKAELVTTDVVFSGITATATDTNVAGLYIFGDYIYYTTPSQHLATDGTKLNHELVLKRIKLDGTDAKELAIFDCADGKIQLVEKDGVVWALCIDGTVFTAINTQTGAENVISESVSTSYFEGDSVYYMDDGKITAYTVGGEAKALKVEPATEEENVTYTYTIKSVCNGYVYYTYTASPSEFEINKVYYTTADDNVNGIAYESTTDASSLYFYKTSAIRVLSATAQGTNIYGIQVLDSQGNVTATLVDEKQNSKAITINKIDGNYLVYTIDSVMYKKNLDNTAEEATAVAYSLGTTASGWSLPDMVGEYVFTISGTAVNVVRFDAEKKVNQKLTGGSTITINVMLTAEAED